MSNIEGDIRGELVQLLRADQTRLIRLARHLDMESVELRTRLSDLERTRAKQ